MEVGTSVLISTQTVRARQRCLDAERRFAHQTDYRHVAPVLTTARAMFTPYVIATEVFRLEAPPGFEPGMEVLQTSALPLGDGADRKL